VVLEKLSWISIKSQSCLLRECISSSGDLEIASARDEVTRERGQNGRERETNNEENFKKKT
jgi:hypothetical protein